MGLKLSIEMQNHFTDGWRGYPNAGHFRAPEKIRIIKLGVNDVRLDVRDFNSAGRGHAVYLLDAFCLVVSIHRQLHSNVPAFNSEALPGGKPPRISWPCRYDSYPSGSSFCRDGGKKSTHPSPSFYASPSNRHPIIQGFFA
jgi:hypothetical protein